MPRSRARRIAEVLVWVGLIAFLIFCLSQIETIAGWLQWMDAQGPIGDVLFVVFYLIASLATLSAAILEGGAGFLYGPLLAVPIAVVLSTLGATLGFLLGRTLLRRRAARWIADQPRLLAIEHAIRDEPLRVVILLRLPPLAPFNMLSIALGAMPVPLGTFVLGTVIGHVFPVLVFTYTGSTVASAFDLANTAMPPWATAGSLALTAIATLGVTQFVRRALR